MNKSLNIRERKIIRLVDFGKNLESIEGLNEGYIIIRNNGKKELITYHRNGFTQTAMRGSHDYRLPTCQSSISVREYEWGTVISEEDDRERVIGHVAPHFEQVGGVKYKVFHKLLGEAGL